MSKMMDSKDMFKVTSIASGGDCEFKYSIESIAVEPNIFNLILTRIFGGMGLEVVFLSPKKAFANVVLEGPWLEDDFATEITDLIDEAICVVYQASTEKKR